MVGKEEAGEEEWGKDGLGSRVVQILLEMGRSRWVGDGTGGC